MLNTWSLRQKAVFTSNHKFIKIFDILYQKISMIFLFNGTISLRAFILNFRMWNNHLASLFKGFPGGWVVKNLPAMQEMAISIPGIFNPWDRKILWRGKWLPTPVFLPGESHGQRRLAGYSPWVCKELDTTSQLNNKNNSICRNTYFK